MTRAQAEEEVKAWTSLWTVKCVCGNTNDFRSHIRMHPDTDEVAEIHIYCPKCSETIFKKTIEKNKVSEFSHIEG